MPNQKDEKRANHSEECPTPQYYEDVPLEDDYLIIPPEMSKLEERLRSIAE